MLKYKKKKERRIKQYQPKLLFGFPFMTAFNFELNSNTIVHIAK